MGGSPRGRRRRALHCAVLLATALVLATAPAAGAFNGFLHTSGMRIVDGSGQEVRLRGVNLGNWLQWEGFLMCSPNLSSPTGESGILRNLASLVGQARADRFQADVRANYTTQADFQAIAALGYNSVRLAFNHRLVQDDAGNFDEAGLQTLDRAIGWARAAGLYTVLDLHAAPGGANTLQLADPDPVDLWHSEAAKTRTVDLWRELAARYRDDPSIAGYDLINESVSPGPLHIMALYRRIIAAVRSVDPNHLIFLEGDHYGTTFLGFPKMPTLDANTALSFHQYLWAYRYPEQALLGVEAAAEAIGAPLWNGEFGNDSYANVAKQVDRYNPDPKVNGWSLWLWKGCRQLNGHKSVNDFPTTRVWTKTIAWLTEPTRSAKPTVAEAEQGMRDYVRNSSATPVDQLMVDALRLSDSAPAIAPAGTGSGLQATFFGDQALASTAVQRTDPGIDFYWGYGSPAAGVPADHFSARWTGTIEPRWSETYEFTASVDDGVRLYIDDVPLIDRWSARGHGEFTGRIRFEAGHRYRIRVDYLEDTQRAGIKLEWQSARQPRQVVPVSQLYPG